jgi:glycoside/pentoside/hexuronide:cation symporter, GPH family
VTETIAVKRIDQERTGPKALYSLANFPTGLVMGVMNTWLMYYYCPPGDSGRTPFLEPALYGFLIFLLNIPSAVADPTIGHLSDRTRSRWGRRIPYMLFGAPVLALSFILMWFPPTKGISSANAVWLIVTVLAFYLSFTAVVNPYLAIMPEVWTTEKSRMSVSALMAVTGGLGTLGSFAAGVPIEALAAGVILFGFHLDGYTAVAIVTGLLTLIFIYPSAIWIRETPHDETKEVPFSILRSGWETLKNPAFLPYIISISLLQTSTNLVIAMMPYQVKVLAGSTEGMAGALLGALMVLAMLLFPLVNRLAEKIARWKLYLFSCLGLTAVLPFLYFTGKIPGIPPLVYLAILLLGIAPVVSVFLVVPRTLLADVMDYDEKLTGFRREAMYNGMEGLIAKVSSGLAPWIMGTLFSIFGNDAIRSKGIQLCPVAGCVLAMIACVAFLRYPLRK